MQLTVNARFFPTVYAVGKWHINSFGVSDCTGMQILDTDIPAIHYNAGTDIRDIHPICCKKCVKANTSQ